MTQYRHGDVFIQAEPIPAGAVEQPRRGDIILAEGEVTNHAHRIKAAGVRVWEAEGQRYIEVPEGGAVLQHEEHARIDLPAGTYRTWIQRVYEPEGIRQVAD